MAALGDTRQGKRTIRGEDCDVTEVCEDGGFVYKAPKMKTTCEDPFTDMGPDIGCLYWIDNGLDMCDALEACMDVGGNLYSADTDEEFQNLQTLIKNNKNLEMDLWVDVEKVDGSWIWRHKDNKVPDRFWKDGIPGDGKENCAKIKGDKQYLESKQCVDKKNVLCRMWVQN
ncbi:C-type lectin-like [Trinorchestia longiramus]|nr:C-type lectin-like [Trinorchestia longiramus]